MAETLHVLTLDQLGYFKQKLEAELGCKFTSVFADSTIISYADLAALIESGKSVVCFYVADSIGSLAAVDMITTSVSYDATAGAIRFYFSDGDKHYLVTYAAGDVWSGSEVTAPYLPLTGGTVTGPVKINGSNGEGLYIRTTANFTLITFDSDALHIGDKITINGPNSTEPNVVKIENLVTPTAATDAANKGYVDSAIAAAVGDITGFEYEVISALPATGEKGKIYLVANTGSGQNIYDEYIWIAPTTEGATGTYEKIGTTEIDLSNYYNTANLVPITTAQIDALFA